jgi:sugar phosphate isomerase/epimerase
LNFQNFKRKDLRIVKQFIEARKKGLMGSAKLNLSWSNWGFGMEKLEASVQRLSRNNIKFVELHGNLYGKDLGYKPDETIRILNENGLDVSGICGMVYPYSEFASNNHYVRQTCIDYFRRLIDFGKEVGAKYILFTPGAVGRTKKYDETEFYRAAEGIRIVSEDFYKAGIRCAIEPVRRDEVSFCFTIAEANSLIEEVNHPGCRYIAGDTYHQMHEEPHIGEALVGCGEMLTNLHLADTNRRGLGTGSLDLDIVIMALYAIGYNNKYCFCTLEPLGGGANPYDMLYGQPDVEAVDALVKETAEYFFERENEVLSTSDEELLKMYGG